MADEMSTLQFSDETSVVIKPDYLRQSSLKRQYSDNDKNHIDKRRRPKETDSVTCPVADFGCLTDIPSDDLQEHYSTKIHQQCLMKAIALYAQQIHIEPKDHSSLLNKEENYSEILDSVDILAEGLSCLHDDNIQIHNNLVQIRSNILEQQNQIEQLKGSIEESAEFLHASQINNNILQTEIETLRQMIKDLQTQSSNDGTFIWKITDVAKKISDAIAERQTSVYSPPFYSSPAGYKMCMRLYFNGDGHARRTHLSLFFVLMRGENDAVLEWPFSYKITFCLYDQTNNARHIIDSFRPDVKSNSFQRPRSSMNIASGVPKFCPLPTIQQDNNSYVRDDCMFIRCMVDFSSTPKTMLPYICSLNPGLPTIVQQTMIQAELERRKTVAAEKSDSQDSSPKKDDLK